MSSVRSTQRDRQRSYRHRLVRRGLIYSLSLVFLILGLGGVGFWCIDPQVPTLADGLWLAFTTAATVGYGDVIPTTSLSKAFSVLVVLLGLAVLSLVTASLAALFVENEVESEERELRADLVAEIRSLRAEVRAWRAAQPSALSSGDASSTPPFPTPPPGGQPPDPV